MHKFILAGILLLLMAGIASADSYIHGNGQLIAKINETGMTYYHLDNLRSTSAATNEAGKVVEEQKNLPFGEPLEGSEKYGFTGKELDETDLQYFGARYYSPLTGRFLNPDPAMDGLNWYWYAEGNPLTRIDPTGTTSFALFVKPPEEEITGGIYPPQSPIRGKTKDRLWLSMKRRVLYSIATQSNRRYRTKGETFLGLLNSLNPWYEPRYTGSLIEGIDLIGYRLGRKPLNLPPADEPGSFSMNEYVKEKPLANEKAWPTKDLLKIVSLGEGENYDELYLTHISYDDGSYKTIREKPEKVTMPFHLGLYIYQIKRDGDEFKTSIRDEWDFHGSKQAQKLEQACENPLILKYEGSIKVEEVEKELKRRKVEGYR